jgi:hypothetical protein
MCPYTSIIATDRNVKDFSHEIKKKKKRRTKTTILPFYLQ